MKAPEKNAAHQRAYRLRHPLLIQARRAAERRAHRELMKRHREEYRRLYDAAFDEARRDRGIA